MGHGNVLASRAVKLIVVFQFICINISIGVAMYNAHYCINAEERWVLENKTVNQRGKIPV